MVARTPARIAGVLLAAGTSSRMGQNKLFLTLAGESVLRRAVRTAAAAGLDPILVVLGHAELEGLDCLPVLNPEYASGINTSLRSGIGAVPDDVAAAVVLLADMPFVTGEMIRTLVERYRSSHPALVVSTYQGVDAPPMLYDRSLFAELRALSGDGCGKKVVKRHRGEALELAWPAGALTDLDVPEDVERVRAELGAG
jgi:molybdenum cofactor cytidylyltransferase